ncbi:MAG: pantetheine-phosphate adenylyltransferase [Oscillospiraceae bacterium]|nr:pantetheine-phosphate adenylyltransferase [Oscillospiraceae bacterium]
MKIAICPGSFDPVTKGHVDILERSSKLFDKVIAVVLVNPTKTPTFTTEERVDLIKRVTKHIPNLEVDSYTGLVADYAQMKNAHTLIKGLRAVTDFEYEFQQALINKKLNPELETLFMVTNQDYMYLSSTLVRQIAEFGGDIDMFVPEEIKDILKEKMIKEKK